MTMDTAVVTTDFDRLAERVERAAAVIQELREKQTRLETEKAELARRLEETTARLQGNDPAALVADLGALKKEQREWLAERKDVATRIESLLRKLERIEG
jgi:chromosome segregation ATPase